jgi:hypothetical protein
MQGVIDIMRPLFDKGLRPEALSALMVELHTKTHARSYLKREFEYERDKRLNLT